jgi:sugar phosphate isomerase/epimerase
LSVRWIAPGFWLAVQVRADYTDPRAPHSLEFVMTTRRHFLTTAVLTASGLSLPSVARAIEPIRRPSGSSRLKLSIAAYSYRQYLNLTAKPKPSMTLPEFIDQSSAMGVDAVELTAYYFPETTPAYLNALKGQCTRLGLDVSGTAIGNNFCVTDSEKLKDELTKTKAWIEHTARLGGKTMRIFAGNLARGDSEEKARARCVASIQEACDHAAKYGVYLALENHGGITATPEQILAIVQAVKHDWFGVNLDTGNFRTADPYADLAKLAPYAVVAQIKTDIAPKGSPMEPADLKKVIGILRDANYRGYVALEYEGKEEPKVAVPRYLTELRKLVG